MSAEHHSTLSPSSFPMLAKCPCYASGEPGDAALSGSRQHKLLAAMLDPKVDVPEDNFGCSTEECAQVAWAHDYVVVRTSDSRQIEKRFSLIADDFEEITFGTLDVVDVVNRQDGDVLVVMDYKSGEDHGYLPQMAVYARMAMIAFGHARAEVHELYGRRQYAKKYVLNLADTDFILDVIDRVQATDKEPAFCEFCNWCAKSGTCPAATKPVQKVATEYEPENPVALLPLSQVKTWHASEITDPEQMAIVYRVAEHVAKWASAVKAHANEAARNGMRIPGYELKSGNKPRSFGNIEKAYEQSGLSASEFLSCCTASVPDVEKLMASKLGFKTATGKAAKEAFNAAMADVVVVKENAPTLKAIGA